MAADSLDPDSPPVSDRTDAGEAVSGRPSLARRLFGTRTRSWLTRVALGLSGLGLFVGFFLPWVRFGKMVSASGFGLMVSQGEIVQVLSGPARTLLLAVPVLGAMLLFGAATGHAASLWVALFAGVLVIGYGLFMLVTLFLQTTGLGLWVVVACAFLSLIMALLGMGGVRK